MKQWPNPFQDKYTIYNKLPFSPQLNARRLAAAMMKSKCRSLLASNVIVFGHLLGPDQNGVPDEVTYVP